MGRPPHHQPLALLCSRSLFPAILPSHRVQRAVWYPQRPVLTAQPRAAHPSSSLSFCFPPPQASHTAAHISSLLGCPFGWSSEVLLCSSQCPSPTAFALMPAFSSLLGVLAKFRNVRSVDPLELRDMRDKCRDGSNRSRLFQRWQLQRLQGRR